MSSELPLNSIGSGGGVDVGSSEALGVKLLPISGAQANGRRRVINIVRILAELRKSIGDDY